MKFNVNFTGDLFSKFYNNKYSDLLSRVLLFLI